MRLLACLVVLVPSVALAQPAPPQPPPPPPESGPYGSPAQPGQEPYAPGQPGPYGQPGQGPGAPGPYGQPDQGPYAPAQPGQGPYAPAQPGHGPYAPAPYGQPPPYGQPYAPPPPPPRSLRTGLTFEANLGVGWLMVSDGDQSDTSDVGMGGLCLGIGGWMNERLAITARLAGVTLQRDSVSLSHIFLGPSAQFWLSEQFWVGGGIGLSIASARASSGYQSDSISGLGLDLRAGVTLNPGSKHTFNASLELNPGFYNERGQSVMVTGVAILLGYQLL
jgi:hypothetical protein